MGEGVKILEKGDVAPGSSTAVDVREQKVAVFNVAGTFYAIDDTCTHALSEGAVSGTTVICPRAQIPIREDWWRINPARPKKASLVTRWSLKATTVSIEL